MAVLFESERQLQDAGGFTLYWKYFIPEISRLGARRPVRRGLKWHGPSTLTAWAKRAGYSLAEIACVADPDTKNFNWAIGAPAVRVLLVGMQGPYSLTCDWYWCPHDNLRAICRYLKRHRADLPYCAKNSSPGDFVEIEKR